jgi:hypothetical protein
MRSPTSRPWLVWLLLAGILLAGAAVRWRLLDFPLERDEGEYAYNAQLMLDGVPPYRLAHASQKLPGASLMSALALALWSELPQGLHFGLLLVNAASTVLLFLLVRRLAGAPAGLFAAGAFALLNIGQGVLGFAAHATHHVVVWMLAGFVALLGALDSQARAGPRLFAAGALLGCSVLARQPAAVFAALAMLAVLVAGRRAALAWSTIARREAALLLGLACPLVLLALWLWSVGVLGEFWFWTVTYALSYGSQATLHSGWLALQVSLPAVIGDNAPLWLLALAGLIALLVRGGALAGFFAAWLAGSIAAVAAGLFFRHHYFVQLLPVVAALFGIAAAGPAGGGSRAAAWRRAAGAAALVALAASTWLQRDYLFRADPERLCRETYHPNLFVEIEQVARELRARSRPDETIAVLGSEAQLYAYAQRRSATPFIYTYALTEISPFAQRFQREFIADIERARPRFIVWVLSPLSWLVRPDSVRDVFDWSERFLAQHYRPIGVAEFGRPVRWDEAARSVPLDDSLPQLRIFERL